MTDTPPPPPSHDDVLRRAAETFGFPVGAFDITDEITKSNVYSLTERLDRVMAEHVAPLSAQQGLPEVMLGLARICAGMAMNVALYTGVTPEQVGTPFAALIARELDGMSVLNMIAKKAAAEAKPPQEDSPDGV